MRIHLLSLLVIFNSFFLSASGAADASLVKKVAIIGIKGYEPHEEAITAMREYFEGGVYKDSILCESFLCSDGPDDAIKESLLTDVVPAALAWHPDLVVVQGVFTISALKQVLEASEKPYGLPVVFLGMSSKPAVELGFVESIDRPGGQFTGVCGDDNERPAFLKIAPGSLSDLLFSSYGLVLFPLFDCESPLYPIRLRLAQERACEYAAQGIEYMVYPEAAIDKLETVLAALDSVARYRAIVMVTEEGAPYAAIEGLCQKYQVRSMGWQEAGKLHVCASLIKGRRKAVQCAAQMVNEILFKSACPASMPVRLIPTAENLSLVLNAKVAAEQGRSFDISAIKARLAAHSDASFLLDSLVVLE